MSLETGSQSELEDGDIHRRHATVNDVARLAGVSKSTVSKVLNERGGIRAETRAAVRSAARKLGYTPNPQARSLMDGKTGTVGLLSNDLEGRFALPILMGAEDALGAGKISVFLCDARGDAIREQYHLEALLNRRVDGLIVLGDTAIPRRSFGRLPVPVVYASAKSLDPEDVSVVTDESQAARIGAEHLLAVGRSRIAYVSGDPAYAAAHERPEAAQEFLREKGLGLVTAPLFGAWSETWGRQAARNVLTAAPDVDAIMCGDDRIARGVMDSLRDLGRSIPGDVAVLGHGNWEVIASESIPPMSSIDPNYEAVGVRAAELLFSAMAGDPQPGVHKVLARVMPRASTI